MTPALPDLMTGMVVALSTPQAPETGAEYMAGRIAMIAMVLTLAGQEAEKGVAGRVSENAAIRETLGEPAQAPASLEWRALDAENAELRRRLITAHEAAELANDAAADARFLDLYIAMADHRRLSLF